MPHRETCRQITSEFYLIVLYFFVGDREFCVPIWILPAFASICYTFLLMRISILLLLIPLFSCSKNKKAASGTTAQVMAAVHAPVNYDSCRRRIAIIKKDANSNWGKLRTQEKEKIFTEAVVKTIVPAWIGTPWTFSGTTEKPGEGSIACGYFVTTVLRDAGLPIARVKLAQAASEEMIKVLVQSKYIQRFSNRPMEEIIAAVNKSGAGLYLVGLDNHTGFLYHDGTEIWFIHSTFVGTRDVQYEKAATSIVLNSSKYKVIGKLSADEKVLGKWIAAR
jgi:hypothetical protein